MDKKISEIQKDYLAGMKYKDLQEKHKITNGKLIYLIQKNKWKRESNRKEALKQNQNAKGNKGGPGAEKGNKRALTTGEYENLFSGCFSCRERIFFETNIEENNKEALLKEYKTLIIRESRMLKRIEKLENTKKDMTIIRLSRHTYKSDTYNNDTTTTEAESTIMMIQKIEEGLTRVQESIRRCLDSMHKMNIDNKRLEIELAGLEGDEIEDTSETDADIYGS